MENYDEKRLIFRSLQETSFVITSERTFKLSNWPTILSSLENKKLSQFSEDGISFKVCRRNVNPQGSMAQKRWRSKVTLEWFFQISFRVEWIQTNLKTLACLSRKESKNEIFSAMNYFHSFLNIFRSILLMPEFGEAFSCCEALQTSFLMCLKIVKSYQ